MWGNNKFELKYSRNVGLFRDEIASFLDRPAK